LWVDQPVFFLAMSRLFNPPWVGKMLRFLFCIPLERKKDIDGRPVNNVDSFNQAYAHLSKGGHLFIAPDGAGELERNLLDLKSGAARIAIGAELRCDFELGLKILPLGYTYFGHDDQLGSPMLIKVGEAIELGDFAELSRQDEALAFRNLTVLLAKRMRDLLHNVEDAEEDQTLRQLETLQQSERPLPLADLFERSKRTLLNLRNWALQKTSDHTKGLTALNDYFQVLKKNGLRDRSIWFQQQGSLHFFSLNWPLLLVIPVWFFAHVNHLLITQPIRFLIKKMNMHVGYKTTIELVLGVILVPIVYFLQSWLVEYLFSTSTSWYYLLSIATSGIIASHWRSRVRDAFSWVKLCLMSKAQKAKILEKRKLASAFAQQLLAD
jgi:glycerol-3-phosphate O-acyltransferase / dihydroxyacetone phosphate acyltransferase